MNPPQITQMGFLKKTSKINLKNEDLVIEDESRAQNTNNSNRSLCKPTIDGVKDPNILVKSGDRFGINAIGFQGITNILVKSGDRFGINAIGFQGIIVFCKFIFI